MKYKIVGIKESNGVFNDKPYTNFNLYYQVLNPEKVIGVQVEKIKVSKVVFDRWLIEAKSNDPKVFIGKEFDEIFYNAYKQVMELK